MDIERRVLAELGGVTVGAPKPPESAIVVAETLYPSQLKSLADAGIAGIATSAGGATSHAAIIASGLGLPMVVGLGPALDAIEDGATLILDGASVRIATDDAEVAQARRHIAVRAGRREAARARAHEQTLTADGTRIEVFANLGSAGDVEIAVAEGAEGCGLLRTEFLFLDRETRRTRTSRRALPGDRRRPGGRPLIIRTAGHRRGQAGRRTCRLRRRRTRRLACAACACRCAAANCCAPSFAPSCGWSRPGRAGSWCRWSRRLDELRAVRAVLEAAWRELNADARRPGGDGRDAGRGA